VVAGRRQGAAGELAGSTRMVPGKAVGVELTRAVSRRRGGGGCFGGGVHRRGGSSGGRWRWRHDPAMSVQKRKGEGGLKWGQQWRMGGSHRKAAEAVVLRREPKRRRGSPARWTCRR
jgi:hypothetical protein